MLDESTTLTNLGFHPTLANLGNDEGILSSLIYAFLGSQSKPMTAYAQSGQYRTIMESRVHLTWYQSYALNLTMLIEFSNVEQKFVSLEGIVKNN